MDSEQSQAQPYPAPVLVSNAQGADGLDRGTQTISIKLNRDHGPGVHPKIETRSLGTGSHRRERMSKRPTRVFSRKFKLAAVHRMLAGENISALARELKVLRKDLNCWRARYRSGGPEALRGPGRPPKAVVAARSAGNSTKQAAPDEQLAAARARIAELERKIGRQQVDIDFFQEALRQIEGIRRANAEIGATASTKSPKR
jgi:transposase